MLFSQALPHCAGGLHGFNSADLRLVCISEPQWVGNFYKRRTPVFWRYVEVFLPDKFLAMYLLKFKIYIFLKVLNISCCILEIGQF